MKLKKTIRFHARIMETIKFLKSKRKNNEIHENHKIPPTEIVKIMKVIEVQARIKKIMKILEFHLRIIRIMKNK